jgi:hypothetical protein
MLGAHGVAAPHDHRALRPVVAGLCPDLLLYPRHPRLVHATQNRGLVLDTEQDEVLIVEHSALSTGRTALSGRKLVRRSGGKLLYLELALRQAVYVLPDVTPDRCGVEPLALANSHVSSIAFHGCLKFSLVLNRPAMLVAPDAQDSATSDRGMTDENVLGFLQ